MNGTIDALIEGVEILVLRQMVDDRGAVLHMLSINSTMFSKFGEIYFSEINGGLIKAWKRHKRMTQHIAVPKGRVRLVIHDDRRESPTIGKHQEMVLGRPDHYWLVRIPPGLWYGFQGLDESPSLIANCADMPHDPEQSENRPITDPPFNYCWP